MPQRGGAVPDPVWVGPIRLLALLRITVTPGTPLSNGLSFLFHLPALVPITFVILQKATIKGRIVVCELWLVGKL